MSDVQEKLGEWVDQLDCERQVGVPDSVSMTAYEQDRVVEKLERLLRLAVYEFAKQPKPYTLHPSGAERTSTAIFKALEGENDVD